MRFKNPFKLITHTYTHTGFTHFNALFDFFSFYLDSLFFFFFNNLFSRLSITSVISFGCSAHLKKAERLPLFLCSCVARTQFISGWFAWERDAEKCVQIKHTHTHNACVLYTQQLHKFSIKLLLRVVHDFGGFAVGWKESFLIACSTKTTTQ